MRFLAIGEPTPDYTPEAAAALMDSEIGVAQQLYAEQVIREGYMDETYTRAVLLLDAPSNTDVHAQVARYPMVRAGLIQFSIMALTGLPAIQPTTTQDRDAWWPHD